MMSRLIRITLQLREMALFAETDRKSSVGQYFPIKNVSNKLSGLLIILQLIFAKKPHWSFVYLWYQGLCGP